jgi:DNA-binding MarR family transcriptional regulator
MQDEQRDIPLIGLFQIAHDLSEEHLFSRLAEAGFPELRPAHGCVFGTISRGGDRLTVLAERADMTKQAVGEAVSELERIGYVERVPDPDDGRAKIIRLTKRGEAAWENGWNALAELREQWEERYGRDRVRNAIELLAEIAGETRRDPLQAAHSRAA